MFAPSDQPEDRRHDRLATIDTGIAPGPLVATLGNSAGEPVL